MLPTPNLDRLAREGVRFTDSNCSYPVCVPSRTEILTGSSSATTHVYGNDAAKDMVSDPGPSFDNLLHEQGYMSRYYGKWHAPYNMTRTYDNKVASIPILPGIPNEHKEFLAYLKEHTPPRPAVKGELFDNDYARFYRPYPVDTQYAEAQQGGELAERRIKRSQQGVVGVVDVPAEYSLAAYTASQTLPALGEMKEGPFSLTCSIGPPHPPFLAVEPYADMFPAANMPLPKNLAPADRWSPYRLRAESMAHYHNADYVRQFTSAYYAMVADVDHEVGRVLDRLDELNLAHNTLVIFTADHGEMLGSHGMVSKMVFYQESVRVPLLMRMPGVIAPGSVVKQPVSGRDLFATILDYLAVKAPKRDGYSLRPLIEGSGPSGPDYRVSEWATDPAAHPNVPNYMVRTADWKLMMAESPESHATDALYDMKNDPFEMHNLLGPADDRSKYAGRADEMKERLITWLEQVHSPFLTSVKARKLV
jgi:arylsulfatase A-like enzyme